MRICLAAACSVAFGTLAQGQVFVAALGGFAALSGAAATQASPPAAASYDPKVGGAFNIVAGYHINDWFSAQAGVIGNRNRVLRSELAGGALVQQTAEYQQAAIGVDVQVYFRPRSSWVRPYLSAGPAWVHMLGENKLGLRVAVGADLMHKSGWGVRYTFSEMMSGNAIGARLRPAAAGRLMNFQNLFGVVKVF